MNNILSVLGMHKCNFSNTCKSKICKVEHLYDFEVGKGKTSNENGIFTQNMPKYLTRQ